MKFSPLIFTLGLGLLLPPHSASASGLAKATQEPKGGGGWDGAKSKPKSPKHPKAAKPDSGIIERLESLETKAESLETRTESLETCNEDCVAPPPDICAESKDRILQLNATLPAECAMTFQEGLGSNGRHRIVCTKTPTATTRFPPMCNPHFAVIAAGGSGGRTVGYNIITNADDEGEEAPLDFPLSGGGGGGGVVLVTADGESTLEGDWSIVVGKGRDIGNGEDSYVRPVNPNLVSSGIDTNKLYAVGGGEGGGIYIQTKEQRIGDGGQCDTTDFNKKGILEDRTIIKRGQNGGSGGGGPGGCQRNTGEIGGVGCPVPSACILIGTPELGYDDYPVLNAPPSEGGLNSQLTGGYGIPGQGYDGGDGGARTFKGEAPLQIAGGGGGAGAPGDDAKDSDSFTPMLNPDGEGTNYEDGGIGRNLTEYVGSDLGDEGFFGGGGAALFGQPGKGGGGCGSDPPKVNIRKWCKNKTETMPNTGGGGGHAWRRDTDVEGEIINLKETESFPGGSGVVIVTFDACGCD